MDTSKPSGLTFSSAPQLPQELPASHWQSLHRQSLLCLYICSFDRWAGRQRPHWAEVKLTSSSVAILILFDFIFPFLVAAIVSEAPCGCYRHCALPPQHVCTFEWFFLVHPATNLPGRRRRLWPWTSSKPSDSSAVLTTAVATARTNSLKTSIFTHLDCRREAV